MKYRWDKKYLYWGVTALLVMCASICFFYLVFHSSSVTSGFQRIVRISMPIINGLAMAYLFTPIVNWSENTLLLPIYRKIHPTMNKKEKSRMR